MQWVPEDRPDIFMLTSDMAMTADSKYRPFVDLYANDIKMLETDFSTSWYRLTSADMGPATRCIGDMLPSPQPFQFTLPPSPSTLPN